MNKMMKTVVATAITALSINAHAEIESPFTYLEYSVGNIEYDNSDDGDYSALSGSLELPILILPILSAELIDSNETDITKLGAGSYLQFGDDTYLYGLIHYNDYEGDIDSDLSLTAGLRHRIMENLYVDASYITYTDQEALEGIKASLGYHLHENFSLSANYQDLEYTDILSVSARLSF